MADAPEKTSRTCGGHFGDLDWPVALSVAQPWCKADRRSRQEREFLKRENRGGIVVAILAHYWR
jgi:hypothetical protein